jgi:uncharacterized protein YdeI (YjbR/CyaY-like superfamily)
MAKRYSRCFTAPLQRTSSGFNWVVVRIPFDAAKLWGKRGHIRVRGTVNGFEFRSNLFPDGQGHHYLTVNRKVQAGAGVRAGIRARFRMEPDTAARSIQQPTGELLRALKQSKELRRFYDSLPASVRREIPRWIAQAKQPQTRVRRSQQMAERLMETLEAEQELPPLIRVAMSMNPRAQAAWQRMPPGKKRGQLLAIFYYRDPEARARRVARVLENIVAYEEKRGG